ncbi:MAG: AgmX/PglI C-terminal domain-containing protein [Myxococcales bacterium]|nr:AgmX/PglI C-terminal domain-containing protein [Myxococcales bacterium]
MSHPLEETLLQYRFGTLERDEAAEVAEHLRTCSDCTRTYAKLGERIERLGAYDVEGTADEATLAKALERATAAFEVSVRKRATGEAHPVAPAPAPAPLPVTVVSAERADEPLPGFWAWLGVTAGGSARPLRLATLALLVLSPAFIGGSRLYLSSRLAPMETIISGESSLQAGGHGLVRVEVRREGVAIPDAPLSLALVTSTGRIALTDGRTDSLGNAELSVTVPSTAEASPLLEVTTRAGDETDVVSVPLQLQRSYKVHLSTDKPMYQPGQTIHLRSLVMRSPRPEPASDKSVLFEVRDARNARLFSKSVPVSSYGIASTDLELSDDVALGAWKLTATVEGVTADAQVEVGRYTLPKYKLAIVPNKETYLAGERVKARVTARYFFGKPVVGAQVQGVLLKRDGVVLAELKGKTDGDGTLTLEAELPSTLAAPGMPEGVVLQLEAKDVAGQQEHTERALTVSRELLMVDVLAEGSAVRGLENTFFVVTTRPDGRPVPAKVEVQPMSGSADLSGLAALLNPARLTRPPGPGQVGTAASRQISVVGGAMDKEMLARVINSKLGEVSACAERALLKTPDVAGKLVVEWQVSNIGAVKSARSRSSTVRNPELEACVLARVRTWRFPQTSSGGTIVFPFMFRDLNTFAHVAPWRPSLPPVSAPLAVGQAISVRTAENGLGRFQFRPEGELVFQVRVEDAEGRKTSREVVLSNGSGSLLTTDKAFYRPGETVLAEVQSSAVALVELEARSEGRLIAHTPMKLMGVEGARATASLILPRDFVGTLELRLPNLNASRRIVVAEPAALSVAMSTDKPTYRPGEPATLRFTVTDAQGKPKVAALGLSVVDESLFALTANTPDVVRAFFLVERALLTPRYGLNAGELLSSKSWTEEQQVAGRLLLSMSANQFSLAATPQRYARSTVAEKLVAREAEEMRWREAALVVGPGAALLLLLVLVVSLSVRVGPVAGGMLVAGSILAAGWLQLPWLPQLVTGVVIAGASLWALRGRHAELRSALVVMPIIALAASFWTRAPEEDGLFSTRLEEKLVAATPSARTAVAESVDTKKEEKRPEAKRVMKQVGTMGVLALSADDIGSLSAHGPKANALGMVAPAPAPAAPEPPRREVRVRQHFPETLYVHPQLISDEKGVAELTVPLADSITAWRVSALASSADGKLGSMDAPLKVFQDFFVDLDVPVALVRGDEATVPIAIYNYLETSQDVRLEVEKAPWFELLGEAPKKVTLAAGGVEGRSLRLRVLEPGEHKLIVRADGASESDVVARELLVTEAGREDQVSVSGRLTAGAATKVSLLVPEAATGATQVLVKLYPSLAATALDGIEGTLGQPTGCFEQTSATTYPNVLVEEFLRRENRLTPELERRITRLLSLGYQKLVAFEVPGGGFEWFGRAPANQVLTAYGLMEFSDMKRVFPVEPELIERTQHFLVSRQQSDGSWDVDTQMIRDGLFRSEHRGRVTVTAYLTWALTESGLTSEAVERAQRFLVENLEGADDPYTLALMTAGFAKTRHPETARAAAMLTKRAKQVDGLVFFSPTGATAYYGRGAAADVETTALAAYALAKAGREPALVKGALDFLLARRLGHGAWASTQATTLALKALLAGTESKGVPKVNVSINGTAVGAFSLADGKPKVLVLGDRARKGINVVELSSDVDAPFLATATFTLPWRQQGEDDGKPLALTVDYAARKVDVGDVVPVDVLLTYRGSEASGMALVELGVPAGLTPMMEDLQNLKMGRVAKFQVSGGKLRLYLDRLSPGERLKLSLRFKATMPVDTKGAGSLAYLYYDPAVRASAPPVAVAVR